MNHYLIIGNGAAGISAAETLRQLQPQSEITILTAEPSLMYSRPGLAYVATGEITANQVIARTADWYAQQRINLVHQCATELDVNGKRVALANGQTVSYDKLLIATGSRATQPPMPNGDLAGVVYLDTLEGTKALLKQAKRRRTAVVIGGGITAIEMVEALVAHGVHTHYLVRRDRLWGQVFNAVEAGLLAEKMVAHGVKIHYETEADAILETGWWRKRVGGVRLKNGQTIPCDIFGVAIGVNPQLELIQNTSIRQDRGILVDSYLQSSVPDVYAAGDVAQVYDAWTEQHLLDVLWPSAVAEGQVAAINMAGVPSVYEKGIPFNVCKYFGLHITIIGQVNPADDVEVQQHLSRGSSEMWFRRGEHHVSAWSQRTDGTLRLVLADDRIVGALLIGEQSLADPLRWLIDERISVAQLRDSLEAGGEAMRGALLAMWYQHLGELK